MLEAFRVAESAVTSAKGFYGGTRPGICQTAKKMSSGQIESEALSQKASAFVGDGPGSALPWRPQPACQSTGAGYKYSRRATPQVKGGGVGGFSREGLDNHTLQIIL